jgi:hypothetical protein
LGSPALSSRARPSLTRQQSDRRGKALFKNFQSVVVHPIDSIRPFSVSEIKSVKVVKSENFKHIASFEIFSSDIYTLMVGGLGGLNKFRDEFNVVMSDRPVNCSVGT